VRVYMGTGKTDDSSDKGEHQERIQGRRVLDAMHDVIARSRVTRCKKIVNSGTDGGKDIVPLGKLSSWRRRSVWVACEVLCLPGEICRTVRHNSYGNSQRSL
jgi:hypothetical protein